eukprot:g68353.t1
MVHILRERKQIPIYRSGYGNFLGTCARNAMLLLLLAAAYFMFPLLDWASNWNAELAIEELLGRFGLPGLAQQECDANAAEERCFFRETYSDARDQFRALAVKAGAELHTLDVLHGHDLTIDIAEFRRDTSKLLLHISGTHGVEAHAGSAIQAAFLYNWTMDVDSTELPSIVLVHSLNPFGFKYARRWNEENVDLNRNCFLSRDELMQATASDSNFADYNNLDHVLNPKQLPWYHPLVFLVVAAKTLATHGYTAVKRACVTGQYHKPDGLFYGGATIAKSHSLLHGWLREQGYTTSITVGVAIDVHTGLGRQGKDSMMLDDDFDLAEALRVWGNVSYAVEGHFSHGPAGGGAYDHAHGLNSQCLKALFPQDSMLVATQEFGTVPGMQVLYSLICENAAYHQKDYNFFMRQTPHVCNQLVRSSFYVRKDTWKREVVQRGVRAILYGLLYLVLKEEGAG